MTTHIEIGLKSKPYILPHIRRLYELFCDDEAPARVRVLDGFDGLVEVVCKRLGKRVPHIESYAIGKQAPDGQSGITAVALSSGLDSVYRLLSLADSGRELVAFHIDGLNKQYPREDENVDRLAEIAGASVVRCAARHTEPEIYPDNPLKNQLILAAMIDALYRDGVTSYAIGSDWTTDISDSAVGLTVTDAAQVYEEFCAGAARYVDGFRLVMIEDGVKKVDRLRYLIERHANAVPLIRSCLSAHRYQDYLRKVNSEKYGVEIMPGRCGSCYKCCMEYLLLQYIDNGLRNDDAFARHCWHMLATSKYSHCREKFSEGLPVNVRIDNLLAYGS